MFGWKQLILRKLSMRDIVRNFFTLDKDKIMKNFNEHVQLSENLYRCKYIEINIKKKQKKKGHLGNLVFKIDIGQEGVSSTIFEKENQNPVYLSNNYQAVSWQFQKKFQNFVWFGDPRDYKLLTFKISIEKLDMTNWNAKSKTLMQLI